MLLYDSWPRNGTDVRSKLFMHMAQNCKENTRDKAIKIVAACWGVMGPLTMGVRLLATGILLFRLEEMLLRKAYGQT